MDLRSLKFDNQLYNVMQIIVINFYKKKRGHRMSAKCAFGWSFRDTPSLCLSAKPEKFSS